MDTKKIGLLAIKIKTMLESDGISALDQIDVLSIAHALAETEADACLLSELRDRDRDAHWRGPLVAYGISQYLTGDSCCACSMIYCATRRGIGINRLLPRQKNGVPRRTQFRPLTEALKPGLPAIKPTRKRNCA